MKDKSSINSLEDIKAERLRLKERRKDMESSFLSSSTSDDSSNLLSGGLIVTALRNFIFNKFINRSSSKELSASSNPILRTVGKVDKWGITSIFMSLFTHPTARTALSLTKKSFIKWQLFNLGVFLVNWGYKTYKKKRLEKKYEDAIVVEES